MHRLLATALLAVVTGYGLAATARGEEVVMSCILTGPQAAPPIVTPAFGSGRFVIDTDANTIRYRLSFTDLIGDETAAVIHGPAEPGIATDAHLFFLPFGSVKNGTLEYEDSDEDMILSGQTYVNIHSSAFPLDEIRGQIVHMNGWIDGLQASTSSLGSGWGGFTMDTELNTLSYFIEYEGLEGVETMAHLHGAALHLESAPVVHTLPAGSPKTGTWSYDESLEPAILDGLVYVNIHSSLHPGGEIRGQVTPYLSVIDGLQSVPSVTDSGAGVALAALDRDAGSVSYSVTMSGLSSIETSAAIHGFAPAGEIAAALHPLLLGVRKIGVWNYPSDQEDAILAGESYLSIVTTDYPDGELRGQLNFGFVPDEFRRGDSNGDGGVDVGDVVTTLGILFGGESSSCADALDMNDDGAADIGDPVYLLTHLFSGGSALPAPTAGCGPDPTDDSLSCALYDACP